MGIKCGPAPGVIPKCNHESGLDPHCSYPFIACTCTCSVCGMIFDYSKMEWKHQAPNGAVSLTKISSSGNLAIEGNSGSTSINQKKTI